jgi:DnaJ-class molecular chaperone
LERVLLSPELGERVSNDYYEVLGVDRAESPQGIHTAYRKLAKQCHPDLVGGHSKEKFQGIQEAYETLSDPDKRKNYDASIDKGGHRGKSGIEPEPLVPSKYRSCVTYPEPLVRNSSPVEDFFSSSSSHGLVGNGFKNSYGDVRSFRPGFQVTEDEIFQFLMSSLRLFRVDRF